MLYRQSLAATAARAPSRVSRSRLFARWLACCANTTTAMLLGRFVRIGVINAEFTAQNQRLRALSIAMQRGD